MTRNRTNAPTATKAYIASITKIDEHLEAIKKALGNVNGGDCRAATWGGVGTLQEVEHRLARVHAFLIGEEE